MSSLAPRFFTLLRTALVAVAVASGLWAATEVRPAHAPLPDTLADGGQWGNKGGRGIA